MKKMNLDYYSLKKNLEITDLLEEKLKNTH